MHIRDFQQRIEAIYFSKDSSRGLERTFMWFTEEVGELARGFLNRPGGAGPPAPDDPLAQEFADVLAWLVTLASITGLDLEAAAEAKYGRGCPKCGAVPCACAERAGAGPTPR